MKLLTHNMLASNVKGVQNRFPLILRSSQLNIEENDFEPEFARRMFPKLEYGALVQAAKQVCNTLNDEKVIPLTNYFQFL